jgi:hypothetical protein
LRVIVLRLLQHCAPGQTLSNVTEAGATVTEPALLDAKLTTREGEGSWLRLTLKLVEEPSPTVVDPVVKTIFIVLISTVETLVVAVPKSTPLPVIVTASATVLASVTPVNRTVCGTFQLAALKVRVAGNNVIAKVLLEVIFIVLVAPGFPESATETKAVPPSFTDVAPVNTALLSLSAVSKLKLALVVAGAVAVMVTVSDVSFASSTPFNVIV